MSKRDAVDLDALRPVPLAEIIKGPNREWNSNAKAPELFEQWWDKSGRVLLVGMTRKEAARAAWYACAESLGAYDDQPPQPLSRPRRKSKKQQEADKLRASDLTAQLTDREDIEWGHHDSLPRGEHVVNLRKP